MSEIDQQTHQLPALTPESAQAAIRLTRHKKERPIYIIVSIIGVIATFIMVYQFLKDDGLLKEILKAFESGKVPSASKVISMVLVTVGMLGGVVAILMFIVALLVALYRIYAGQLAYSIRVSEKNYPEIYAKVREYTRLLGLRKEPEVYVRQMNGQINAFTSWVPGRAFIQLNAEIVDLAYMEHQDFDTVYFVMAHEFGHIHLHHVQLQYIIWSLLINFVPFAGPYLLAPLLSRAREYSSDRVAQVLTGGKAQYDCLMMLMAGRHSYRYVDPYAYLEEIMYPHNFLEKLARWVTNLVASHPIMPLRASAFMDPYKKSGKLIGCKPVLRQGPRML